MVFSIFWWQHLNCKWPYRINILLTPFVIMVLLSTRVHYSIDVIAAVIFTLWLRVHIPKYVIYFDKFWTCIVLSVSEVLKRMGTFLR